MTDLSEFVKKNYVFTGWKLEPVGIKAKRAYECVQCVDVVTTQRAKHYVDVHFGLWQYTEMKYKKRNWDWDKSFDGGGD